MSQSHDRNDGPVVVLCHFVKPLGNCNEVGVFGYDGRVPKRWFSQNALLYVRLQPDEYGHSMLYTGRMQEFLAALAELNAIAVELKFEPVAVDDLGTDVKL